MKRLFLFITVLVISLVFIFPQVVSAHYAVSGENVSIPASQVVMGSAYIAGSSVSVNGTYDNDVFCAGQTALIDANVAGDVICAAQTLTINGNVTGNLRIAGQSVTISGTVGKNVTVFAQTINIPGTISGDLTVYAQDLDIKGQVGGEVLGGVSNFTLEGKVVKDINLSQNAATIGSNAMVGGQYKYSSPKMANIVNGSTIIGGSDFTKTYPKRDTTPSIGVNVGMAIYWAIALFIIGVCLITCLRRTSYAMAKTIVEKPWICLCVGLIPLFFTPIVFILLCFTIFAIPLAFIMLALWGIGIAISSILLSYIVGIWILKTDGEDTGKNLLALLLGIVITTILFNIPFIGWLLCLIAVLAGYGAIALSVKGMLKNA